MSEYIVDVGNAVEEYIEHFGYMAETYADSPIRELIVRCRDCTFYAVDELGDYCTLFDFEDVKSMADMFCAWGKRKADK